MAFLDNSGDIILDAVLTDEGRKRLAAGDGSFRIVKFALGDDEIDYSLYENSNHPDGRHPSGSAYYDLSILQSPILEAMTNNAGALRSKLINYTRNDFLYLPVIKVNTNLGAAAHPDSAASWGGSDVPSGGYLFAADLNTFSDQPDGGKGLLRGDPAGAASTLNTLVFDQGLDSTDLTAEVMPLGDPRRETQYVVEVDNRLFQVCGAVGGTLATPSFIDDDQIATYLFMQNTSPNYFAGDAAQGALLPFVLNSPNAGLNANAQTVIGNKSTGTGRYGSRFGFKIKSTIDIQNSTALFNQIGATTTQTYGIAGTSYHVIDTVVRVTGYTTGYRVDIPIKVLKKVG